MRSQIEEEFTAAFSTMSEKDNSSIFLFDSLSSTMDKALEIVKLSEKQKLLCFNFNGQSHFYQRGSNFSVMSLEQTAGKGREGREWFSAKSKGIYVTYVFLPSKLELDMSRLTQVASLAVVNVLKSLGLEVFLKFPNDIIVLSEKNHQIQKISGVLVDIKSSARFTRELHIGIGLNVNKQRFSADIPGISIEDLASKTFDIYQVFYLLSKEINFIMGEFFENGFTYFEQDVLDSHVRLR